MSARKPRIYAATGGWFMGLGASGTVFLWGINADDPMPEMWYGVLTTITVMAFLTGLMFKVISDMAGWVVAELQTPRLPRADTSEIRRADASAYVEAARRKYRAGARR